MMSPGARGADGAPDFVGAGRADGSIGRGRGRAADLLSVTTGFRDGGVPLNIGAGCDPDCMNRTLARIVIATRAPSPKPIASRAFQPSTHKTRAARLSADATFFSLPARVMLLRTVPH